MKITDFVKPGFLNKGHISAAEKLLHKGEEVCIAGTFNCRINGGKTDNRLLVVTSHRLLFVNGIVTPNAKEIFLFSDCVSIGEITGGLTKHIDITSSGRVVSVEGAPDTLQTLTDLILNTMEAYPNQAYIEFPMCTVTNYAPATRSAAPDRPLTKRGQAKQRIAENKAAGVACCPKCGSTSLSANKKGFGVGKAAAGVFLTGGAIGVLAGGIGANKVQVTCLNCGHKFFPGKK